jgi:uncharacterized repeat protein (TIGR02543 family)
MAGTYKPTTGTDRTATFQLKSGVEVYGGFAGTETALTQRNPVTNVTTLSGDIGTSGNNSDNSYHVVTAYGITGAILDGFTISGGNANDTVAPNNKGGGMYNYGSSPTVSNVTFSGNKAGMDGGGMYNDNGSNPTVTNVTFSGNSAIYGGGMYNIFASNPTLTNVTFSDNTADDSGGGMYNNGSRPTVTNVIFSANTATRGSGAGMYNLSGSNPTITNVTFANNNSAWDGGGMQNNASSPTIINSTFSGNKAVNGGGGIQNVSASATILINVTFSGNQVTGGGTARGSGGGLDNYSSPNVKVYNSIFWGNTAATGHQIDNNYSNGVVVDSSVVAGGYVGGTNIITADPLLGTLGTYGGFTTTIPLQAGSSAINAGNVTYCAIGKDQRGVSYFGPCDIGAYEYDYAGVATLYVKASASDAKTCLDWDNACSLRTALKVATSGQEIWVADGTHKPTTGTDRAATFQLKNGVGVYGGFAGTETALSQRNPAANITILSGDLLGNDNSTIVSSEPTRSDNSYHVVKGANGATLDGFIITGGNAYNSAASWNASADNRGGGMYNDGVSPILNNLIFEKNTARTWGGGMANFNLAAPVVTNSTFHLNVSGYEGGGMDNHNSGPKLTNVTFAENSAWNQGGGLSSISGCSTELTNVTFTKNSVSGAGGGGVYNYDCNASIRNVIVWGNLPANNQINNAGSSTPVVSYSVVQGGYAGGTNIITSDPLLGTLANYGGSTTTIPLTPGSSAIDMGNDSNCPSTDQRGVTRPKGIHCDIGAVEMDPTASYTISGRVSLGGVGLAGVSINFGLSAATTDANGDYAFTVYQGWSGTVTATKVGYVFSPASKLYSNVLVNQTEQNYTAANGYVISGSAGVAGVTINYTGGSTTSGTGGSYQFTVPLSGWSGTATPFKAGYTFSPTSINFPSVTDNLPGQDYNATAIVYTLTINKVGNGTVTTAPSAPYHYGDVVDITATADTGWTFTSWEGACSETGLCSVLMDANKSVTANFTINTYTLAYTAGTNGSLTGTSPQTVNHGASGTEVTAVPAENYHFVNWSDGVLTASRTDANVSGDINVTANFAINTHTLTYAAGEHGSISGTTSQTVDHGASGTQVTAAPATGYHFVKWSDDSTFNPRTDANVTGDLSVTATFALNSYTLTYTAWTGGTLSGTTPQTVDHGASGTEITAVPDAGYYFITWTDGVKTASRTDVNVVRNINVIAVFSNTYTLNYTAGTGGTISGVTPQTVIYGSNGTEVTAIPDTGYHFVDWSDGVTTAARTDLNVTGDIIVTANFALDNQTPTDIGLSASSINENQPIGTAVGTLSTTDPDAGDTFTYSLTCAAPGMDDASFTIAGASLNAAAIFDYETKASYAICVRTTDAGGLFFDKNFTITVNNVIETLTVTLRSTGTLDGWLLESGENTLKGGTMDVKATTLRLGDDVAKKQYRSILSFATGAALPDTAVITKVTLKVKRQGILGGGNPVSLFKGFMVDIRKGTFGTSVLQLTDWQTPASKSYGPFNTAVAGGWYTIDLTAGKAYINPLAAFSGLTQFRLGFKVDDNNNTVANYLSLFSGNAPAASQPLLILQYYVP